MQAVIINSNSKSDFNLLMELAKKLDVRTKILSQEEIEDISLANAIEIGETGEYIDTDQFIEKLLK